MSPLSDDVEREMRKRGLSAPDPNPLGLFGDILWGISGLTPEALDKLGRDDPAIEYRTASRYVVLHRLADGIRFFAAPADPTFRSNDREVWAVGTVASVPDAVTLVTEWLSGLPRSKLTAKREPPPEEAPFQP